MKVIVRPLVSRYTRTMRDFARRFAAAALIAALAGPAAGQGAGHGAPQSAKDKYDEALEFLKFPSVVECDLYLHRVGPQAQAAELILDKRLWKDAFRLMDKRTGLLSTTLIGIHFHDADLMNGGEVGYVFFADSSIHFWMPKLARELEGGVAAARARASFLGCVTHELVHVYQQNWYPNRMPKWLIEGMAAYAANEQWYLYEFSGGVPALKDSLAGNAAYGRGLLLFLYLDQNFGRPAVIAFIRAVILDNASYRDAAAKVSGSDWEAFAAREQAWVEAYVKAFPERGYQPNAE